MRRKIQTHQNVTKKADQVLESRSDAIQEGIFDNPQKTLQLQNEGKQQINKTMQIDQSALDIDSDQINPDGNCQRFNKILQKLDCEQRIVAIRKGWFKFDERFHCANCEKHYLRDDQVKRHLRMKHQIKSKVQNNGDSQCPKCGVTLWKTQIKQHLSQKHQINSQQDLRILRPLLKIQQCVFCHQKFQLRVMMEHFHQHHQIEIKDGETLEDIKRQIDDYAKTQTVAINRTHFVELQYLHKRVYGRIKRFPKDNKQSVMSMLSEKEKQMIPEIFNLDDEQPQLLHGIVVIKHVFDIHQKITFKILDALFHQIFKPAKIMGQRFQLKCGVKGILRMLVQKKLVGVRMQNDVRQMTYDEEGNKKIASLRSQRYYPTKDLYRIYFQLILISGFDSYNERYGDVTEELIQRYKRDVQSAQVGLKPQFKDEVPDLAGLKIVSTQNLSLKIWFLEKKKEQFSQNGGEYAKYIKQKVWIKTPRQTQLFFQLFKDQKQINYLRAELHQTTSRQQNGSSQSSQFLYTPRNLEKTISLKQLFQVKPGTKYNGKRTTYEQMQKQRFQKMDPEQRQYFTNPNRLKALQMQRLRIAYRNADPTMTINLLKLRDPQCQTNRYMFKQENSDVMHGLTWLSCEKKAQRMEYKRSEPKMLPTYGECLQSTKNSNLKSNKASQKKYEFKITDQEKQKIQSDVLRKARQKNQAQLNELLNLYEWKQSEGKGK